MACTVALPCLLWGGAEISVCHSVRCARSLGLASECVQCPCSVVAWPRVAAKGLVRSFIRS